MLDKTLLQRLLWVWTKLIEKEQKADGSFLDYFSNDPNFSRFFETQTTFSTSLILNCLAGIDYPKLKAKIVRFLLKEKSKNWTFNCWIRNSDEAKKFPCADNWNITSVALAGLASLDKNILKGDELALIAKNLIASEKKPGGPYDVDTAVNANIFYFLSFYEVKLPNVENFLRDKIRRKSFKSKYYFGKYPVLYFLSRVSKDKEILAKYIFKLRNSKGYWENPLHTALAVSALLNLDFPPEKLSKAIDYLGKNVAKKSYAFSLNPALGKEKYYAGSPALTLAMAVEAVDKFRNALESQKNNFTENFEEELHQKVVGNVEVRFEKLNKDFENAALEFLRMFLSKDTDHQVTLLPYFFHQSLGEKSKEKEDLMVALGMANLYGWLAYTIYDDFLDEEGEPKLLPLANLCLREASLIYAKLDDEFSEIFSEIMDKIETANFWEAQNCRAEVRSGKVILSKIPKAMNTSSLSHRSIGVALGPLAILNLMGYKKNSQEFKYVLSWLENYLAARQLNDDMHDWEEDLKRGQLNSVGIEIVNKKAEIDLGKDLSNLRKVFWKKIVKKICQKILRHCEVSKKALEKLKIIEKPEVLINLIEKHENRAKKTLAEQKEITSFIKKF